MQRFIRVASLACFGVLLAACGLFVTPAPTATPVQSLAVTMWVEWPVLQYGREQTVHVYVNDMTGHVVRSATVQGRIVMPDRTATALIFPVTDQDGYTSLTFPVPAAGQTRQMYTVTVDVAFLSHYGTARMEYEVRP